MYVMKQKAQRLKRFYYHFQHYVDLVMWKVGETNSLLW